MDTSEYDEAEENQLAKALFDQQQLKSIAYKPWQGGDF